VWTKADVNEKLEPRLEVDITIEGRPAGQVRCWMEREDGSVVTEQRVEPGKSCIKWDLRGLVDLWWPNGAGTPTRYSFNVELLDSVRATLDHQSVKCANNSQSRNDPRTAKSSTRPPARSDFVELFSSKNLSSINREQASSLRSITRGCLLEVRSPLPSSENVEDRGMFANSECKHKQDPIGFRPTRSCR
jgi:hypothetical protein